MITVYFNKKDLFRVCWNTENVLSYTTKEFFGKIQDMVLSGEDIYIYDLGFWGLCIIRELMRLGYTDVSETALTTSEKLNAGEFQYMIDKHGNFFNIKVDNGNSKTKFIEYRNLVPVDINDIMEEFGGDQCVAMMRSIWRIREEGTRSNTISSAAYNVWKRGFNRFQFDNIFRENDCVVEKICRDAYRGGFCFLKSRGIAVDGLTLDVNSLYAYIMKNRKFPVMEAHYGVGDLPDDVRYSDNKSYYVRFKARFDLKKGYIPFIRTKCDKRHWCLETLSTSDYIDIDGNRFEFVESPGNVCCDKYGEIMYDVEPVYVELCMYGPEFELMFEHYDVHEIISIEYVWWYNNGEIFSNYVDHFYDMKKNAKSKAERRIAKMFLNALTGRMSLNKERENIKFDERSFELIDREKSFYSEVFKQKARNAKRYLGSSLLDFKAGVFSTTSTSRSHVEIGAAITAEARVFIIKKAQANYKHFKYTDTDSLHLNKCKIEDLVDIEIGEELGQFKIEHDFNLAFYDKEKIYVMEEKSGNIHVTCAGLPRECQKILKTYLEYVLDLDGKKPTLTSDEFFGKNLELFNDLCDKDKLSIVYTFKSLCEWPWIKTKDGSWAFTLDGVVLPMVKLYITDYKNYEVSRKIVWYGLDISS